VLDAQENVQDYPIELPDNAKLVSVVSVKVDGCTLYPIHALSPKGDMPCGANGYRVNDNTLWIAPPKNDADMAIEILVALKPSRDGCEIPERIYEDWSSVIVDGAARLLSLMPGQKWAKGALATYYTKAFDVGVARAKNEAFLQKTTGSAYMTGVRF
jgi:hypothetical protein